MASTEVTVSRGTNDPDWVWTFNGVDLTGSSIVMTATWPGGSLVQSTDLSQLIIDGETLTWDLSSTVASSIPLGKLTTYRTLRTMGGETSEIDAGYITVTAGPTSGTGAGASVQVPGIQGYPGWTPIYSAEPYLTSVVLRVIDWTGGGGEKPPMGLYLGPDGFVEDVGDATLFASVDAANAAVVAAQGYAGQAAGILVETEGVRDQTQALRDQAQQAVANPAVRKRTEVILQADLAHGAGTIGIVDEDPDPSKNGQWEKVGASGAGYWIWLNSSTAEGVDAKIDGLLNREADAEYLVSINLVDLGADPSGLEDVKLGLIKKDGTLKRPRAELDEVVSQKVDLTGGSVTPGGDGFFDFNLSDGPGLGGFNRTDGVLEVVAVREMSPVFRELRATKVALATGDITDLDIPHYGGGAAFNLDNDGLHLPPIFAPEVRLPGGRAVVRPIFNAPFVGVTNAAISVVNAIDPTRPADAAGPPLLSNDNATFGHRLAHLSPSPPVIIGERIFCAFYGQNTRSGGTGEGVGSFVVIGYKDGWEGVFQEFLYLVPSDYNQVGATQHYLDPIISKTPDGRLFIEVRTWSSYNYTTLTGYRSCTYGLLIHNPEARTGNFNVGKRCFMHYERAEAPQVVGNAMLAVNDYEGGPYQGNKTLGELTFGRDTATFTPISTPANVGGGLDFAPETSFLPLSGDRVQMYFRTSGAIYRVKSDPGLATWQASEEWTAFPTPSSRAAFFRSRSGRQVAIFNNDTTRINGTIALSEDEGATWPRSLLVEPRAFTNQSPAYFAGCSGEDGYLYWTYDFGRVEAALNGSGGIGKRILLGRVLEDKIAAGTATSGDVQIVTIAT